MFNHSDLRLNKKQDLSKSKLIAFKAYPEQLVEIHSLFRLLD